MAILGAHQSIAGGYYRAAEKAYQTGCDRVQLFTKNSNQWQSKAITIAEAEAPKRAYLATFREFDRLIGVKRIRAFHLNDSRRELGSRVDRHEHIGLGKLGAESFRLLLADRRFRRVPMYLETPKGQRDGTNWDTVNLRTLRQWTSPK